MTICKDITAQNIDVDYEFITGGKLEIRKNDPISPDINAMPLEAHPLHWLQHAMNWSNLRFRSLTLICLIRAPGVLARRDLIVWGKGWDSQLSNGGFGLKIGQLLKKLWRFWPFMIALGSSKLKGALLLGEADYATNRPDMLGYQQWTFNLGRPPEHTPHCVCSTPLTLIATCNELIELLYVMENFPPKLFVYQCCAPLMRAINHY